MTVHLWNTDSDEYLPNFKKHTAGITALAFSPDGKTLAIGDQAGKVQLWQPKN